MAPKKTETTGAVPIEELVDFPCTYMFKAVGPAQDGFASSLLNRAADVLGRAITADEHMIRESKHGRYQSVTMNLFVTSGAQVYEIYAALKADGRVRYIF